MPLTNQAQFMISGDISEIISEDGEWRIEDNGILE
jgi:hypothetical protein